MLSIEFVKLGRQVAPLTIKNKKTISTNSLALYLWFEDFSKLLEGNLIAYSNPPCL